MTYDEIIAYQEEALTLHDAQEASDIYMVSRSGLATNLLIVRVDEHFNKEDAMAQGAVFYSHHQIMDILETSVENGKEIYINMQ